MDAEANDKLDRLRQALIDGELSGPSAPFDFDAFIAEKRASLPSPPEGEGGGEADG